MSATEVPEIVQLVFKMELLASSMSEVRSDHKVCFGASLRHTKSFGEAKKLPSTAALPPSAEKVTLPPLKKIPFLTVLE